MRPSFPYRHSKSFQRCKHKRQSRLTDIYVKSEVGVIIVVLTAGGTVGPDEVMSPGSAGQLEHTRGPGGDVEQEAVEHGAYQHVDTQHRNVSPTLVCY